MPKRKPVKIMKVQIKGRKKRSSAMNQHVSLRGFQAGIPSKYSCWLKTSYTNQVTFVSSGTSRQAVIINSVNPLGGQYPMNASFLLGSPQNTGTKTGMYTQYSIDKVTIKVEVTPLTQSTKSILSPSFTLAPITLGMDPASVFPANSLRETRGAISKSLGTSVQNMGTVTLYKRIDIPALIGVSRSAYSDTSYQGTVAAAPGNKQVYVCSFDTTGTSIETDDTLSYSVVYTVMQHYTFMHQNSGQSLAPV